jgi:membrane-associated HD superfamily phosphohydrolase
VNERALGATIAQAAALVPEPERPRVRRVLSERLLASAEPNARLSEAAREAAAASVTPVLRQLAAGEVIVARGEPLTENSLSVLESAGLYNPREERLEQGVRLAFTSTLLALLLSLPLVYFYTALRHSTTVGQRSFLVLLWAGALVAQRFALLADAHFLFIAFLPLLGAVLFGERLAFVLAVWLGVVTAFFTPGSGFATLLVLLVSGTVAVILARAFRTRASLLLAGLASGVAGALAFAVYTALSGGFGTLAMLEALAWLLGGGVLAGILALAALPLAEATWGF